MMKPKKKRSSHKVEPWDNSEYTDYICYGRNIAFLKRKRHNSSPIHPNITQQEWEDMLVNSAWYNGLNPMVIWDKPKKELLDNWKSEGRFVMCQFYKRNTDGR